jgi:hypothetical protein
MTISPKDLNQNNSGYGHKQMQYAWRDAILVSLSKIMDYYQNGGYDRVIERGKDFVNINITQLSDLPKMHEAHLAVVYLMGKSYQALGQTDNAIGCFHTAYSQHGFEKRMLTSPYDFPGFVQKSGQELQDIARERGEDYVNNFQIEPFFDRVLAKKGGCFIATAAYGSPLASEVVILSRFRDDRLVKSRLGSYFVEIYYRLSPSLASLISRSKFLKRTVRKLLLAPLLGVLRDRTR